VIYAVKSSLEIDADSPREAQAIAAACIEHWDESVGLMLVNGIGGAKGSVDVCEMPESQGVRVK
jgi:hypothetical protein